MSFWSKVLGIKPKALRGAHRGSKDYAIIKEFEGLRLKAYKCPAGVLTIGYGHTKGVKVNQSISEKEADRLFSQDIKEFEGYVDRFVKVKLSANQHEALVSFVYNIGPGAFMHSTLLRKLNDGDYKGAQGQFIRWNKAGGKVLKGLTRRRKAEAKLFGKK